MLELIPVYYVRATGFVKCHRTKILGAIAIGMTAAHDNFGEIANWFSAHPKTGSAIKYLFGVSAMVLGFLNSRRDGDAR